MSQEIRPRDSSLVVFLTGSGITAADDGAYFNDFIGMTADPSIFFIIYVILTGAVVIFGVEKGIEKISKVLMPVLVVIILGISVYTLTIPGALEGAKYYLLPNFEGFTFTMFLKTLIAAMGQLFYSMSIAMGILVTYGSYMRKEDSVENAVHQIEIFDTGIAFLAGMIIVPAVYAFSNGDSEALSTGPSLMFITLPNVFASMRGGQIVGGLFFFLVSLAALTSSISLLETMVSIVSDRFGLSRVISTCICFGFTIILGMTSVLGYNAWKNVTILGYQFLDFYDFISNNVIMPIVAFVTCILIGYFAKVKFVEDEILLGQETFKSRKMYKIMVMVVCPLFMLAILITNFFLKL